MDVFVKIYGLSFFFFCFFTKKGGIFYAEIRMAASASGSLNPEKYP